ncbi:MAG: iron-containing alcohol dehydrogenase, partial [Mobilitalea sp.]
SMGGLLDLPHGECNSILLEQVIDLNFDAVPERYADIAEKMQIEINSLNKEQIKYALLNRIRTLRKNLRIKDVEEVVGLNEEILDKLAEDAMADPCIVTNPRIVTKEEVRTIFERIIIRK